MIEAEHVPLAPPPGRSCPRGWLQKRLGDVIVLKRGYDLPGRDRRPGGSVPVVSSSGITDHHSESRVPGPGVVTGRYGTLGQVFFIPTDFWPLNTTLYVQDFKGNDPRFISYFLRRLDFSSFSDKAAVPGLNRNHLHEATVRIPEAVAEQRAIAHVLATIDDKIELNRHLNATLEAMARALFRSWFLDFDPVQAKMKGRDPGLPKDIAALFPDRLVESELGEIPFGWPVESLADHFEAIKGVSYKGSGLTGERDGAPLHNLNSIPEGGGYKYEGIKFYSGEYAERHRVGPGDVIVANTEQGHDRLLIGYAAIVPRFFATNGIATHHIYRLRARPSGWFSTRFLVFLLNSTQMHDLVSGYANGTTVNMLPIDAVQRPSFVGPPAALVKAFDVLASCSEQRREQRRTRPEPSPRCAMRSCRNSYQARCAYTKSRSSSEKLHDRDTSCRRRTGADLFLVGQIERDSFRRDLAHAGRPWHHCRSCSPDPADRNAPTDIRRRGLRRRCPDVAREIRGGAPPLASPTASAQPAAGEGRGLFRSRRPFAHRAHTRPPRR